MTILYIKSEKTENETKKQSIQGQTSLKYLENARIKSGMFF